MRPRIAKGALALAIQRPRRFALDGMSRGHVQHVKACGCAVCGRTADPHHLMGLDLGRGHSLKNRDRWTIPLCLDHHQGAHDSGDDEAYLASHGIQARELARTLWACRDDVDAMKRAVFRARQRTDEDQRRAA